MLHPSITVSRNTALQQIEPSVLLIVCEKYQVDWKKLQHFGYPTYNHFLQGAVSREDAISWTGPSANITFQNIINKIHNPYFNASIGYSKKAGNFIPSNTLKTETVLYYPYGYCKQVSNIDFKLFNGFITITSAANISVHVVDKRRLTYFSFPVDSLSKSERIELNHKERTYSIKKFFKISLKLDILDNDIQGEICNQYDTENLSTCVMKELSEDMINILGCVPPWMSDTNVCTFHIINSTLRQTVIDNLRELTAKITTTDFDFKWKNCKQPCLKTKEGLV